MSETLEESFIEPIEDEREDADKAIRVESKLYSYPADFTLQVLKDKLENNEIQVPLFQRNYVWNKEKASLLIDSFIRRLPVPAVYLFTTQENALLIVDGHQRLLTVKRFFDGTWENGEKFELALEDENPLNGKSYEDLDDVIQKRFKNSVMRAMIIEPKEGRYANAMYDIFQRLNTGGVLLMPQEIRNCVYHGSFNDTINKLNKLPDWRKIVGEEEEDKRKRDVELILRGITLYHIGLKVGTEEQYKYRPSLKQFLNDFMEVMQDPPKEWLSEIETLFTTTIKIILANLGPEPFHLRKGKMNAPTYDAAFVAFARHFRAVPANVKVRFEMLKENEEFGDLTKERPTGSKSVNGRIDLAERILFRG